MVIKIYLHRVRRGKKVVMVISTTSVFLLTLVPDLEQKLVPGGFITGVDGTEGALATGSTQQVRIPRLREGTEQIEREIFTEKVFFCLCPMTQSTRGQVSAESSLYSFHH